MIREEFANFLTRLKTTKEAGQDLDAIVKEHEHRNVYFYNDACIKKILASEKNISLTTDLINAALNLIGADRVMHPKLENPFIPGNLGYRGAEPDLLLTNDRGDMAPRDRISIEVQHDADTIYKNRVVLYVSRIISNMVKKNEPPILENLNLISFQFTNAYPWSVSRNYRHSVQLRDQEHLLYFDKQTVTLIEVDKFLKHPEEFCDDRSRLAQWLRAIDALNREADFSEFAADPVFKALQNEVKLCNFSSRYLMTEDMKSIDNAMYEFRGRERIAKNMLLDGDSVEKIARITEIPLYWVLDLKKSMELEKA
ncbi:PD-(D/E)XK nuclease family transposase [Fibrobacter sp.]|uniref:PD-(D/E)XK nuclease family transposase n=1 Tax=Fibrobacter sp. TaxID=35828 RepID=UPI00388DD88D